MSYCVSLTIRTSNDDLEPGAWATIWSETITSNLAPMWREAGLDLAECHGQNAGECEASIRAAADAIERDVMRFAKLSPANGWGDLPGCVAFLRRLSLKCRQRPLCTIYIHR